MIIWPHFYHLLSNVAHSIPFDRGVVNVALSFWRLSSIIKEIDDMRSVTAGGMQKLYGGSTDGKEKAIRRKAAARNGRAAGRTA